MRPLDDFERSNSGSNIQENEVITYLSENFGLQLMDITDVDNMIIEPNQ